MDTGDKLLLAINSEISLLSEIVKYIDGKGENITMAEAYFRARLITLSISLNRITSRVERSLKTRLKKNDKAQIDSIIWVDKVDVDEVKIDFNGQNLILKLLCLISPNFGNFNSERLFR